MFHQIEFNVQGGNAAEVEAAAVEVLASYAGPGRQITVQSLRVQAFVKTPSGEVSAWNADVTATVT